MDHTITQVFERQTEHKHVIGRTTLAQRQQKLQLLIDALTTTYRQEIREAMAKDFGKHPMETDLTEIFATVTELKHIKRRLGSWLKKQRVGTPITLIGSTSYVRYEPKGVCLIISPWNFPVLLTFGPLASAIAAGNTAILKPSEMTPHTSALMTRMIGELFTPHEVAIFEGDASVSTALLELPFDHIFFTGSPKVGKVVMAAAAKNLTSVTLELGGKSPTIVDETANLRTAATRIIWGKMINAGQVCIAPDYVLVHASVQERFVELLKQEIEVQYTKTPEFSHDYTRISTARHHMHVHGLLKESVKMGAQIACGGQINAQTRTINPTVVVQVPNDSPLMVHEIFGPVLPIVTYERLEDTIKIINSKEKPLALYLFSTNRRNIRSILDQTRAGGTCINHCVLHFFNSHLPFGGVRHSGQGKGHGFAGFQEFSNARAVLHQHTMSITDLLKPPYANWKQKVIELAIKYL
jgi:aldehyde dehydrogenase (NAD+)